MSIHTQISITPEGPVADALAQAHREQQAGSRAAAGKIRRANLDWPVPGTRCVLRISRMEATAKRPHAVYHCEANPADLLVGSASFSAGSFVAHIVPLLFALFKAALRAMLPSVPAGMLEQITLDHCKLERLTLPYYFDLEDPTEAYRSWLKWHQHLKVVFDGPNRLPARRNSPQVLPVRVTHDPDCRDAFLAELPFGHARISVKRDPGLSPVGKPDMQTVEDRKAMLAQLRRLLCIEVTVDLTKFLYTNSFGLDVPLPQEHRLWTHEQLPEDPVKTIWKCFRWECWLEADLLNEFTHIPLAYESDNAPTPPLPHQAQDLMRAYLDGESLYRHPHIDSDPKKFIRCREALISKAGIDILNPWSVAQLNLCQAMSQEFRFEDRFLPQEKELFAPHTLTKQGLGAAIQRLHAAMQGQVGWAFDISRYEEVAA